MLYAKKGKRPDSLLRAYIEKHDSTGKAYLNQKHCLKRWNMPAKLTDLTPAGEKELGELMGLKRYLEDFSLVAERGMKEIPIWRELLSYAMLFGIADQVAEQMKELYPALSDQLTDYNQSMVTAYSYHYLLYRNMKKAEEQRQQEKRSSGGGGFASLGGGGGSICGGKISWLLPSKIEGEYICDTCHNKIDMENDKTTNLTMQSFREYLAFYDQNQLLKDQFVISERIDFGLWDTKIIFDYQNRLFCMSKNPDKTVFEGKQLKSFTIKEDNSPLFEGSAEGIRRYASTVPERAMALAPQISQFMMNRQMARALDKLDYGKENRTAPVQYFNLPEPFRAFNVELHFDHPYWTVINCDMDGPRFDNTHPDVNGYLRSYQQSMEELEKLVTAFKTVAFPGAPEQSMGLGMAGAQGVHIASAPPADSIEEIKKYKTLMEEGIISQQEFDAKKKQLLGI